MKSRLRLSLSLLTACVAVSTGSCLALAQNTSSSDDVGQSRDSIVIPGPLRSFERMAGISQQASPDEVLPFLARDIFMRGFRDKKPTEYLALVGRYVDQATELQHLVGPSGRIEVSGCVDAMPLLKVLGYRLRAGCGTRSFALETGNPERAFLTIDSGFPLVELEEALQTGTSFAYDYPSARVPILAHENDWTGLAAAQKHRVSGLLSALLADQSVAELYWAVSRQETATRQSLLRAPGLKALLPYSALLDFYGSQLSIRSGRVAVPGGPASRASWRELVGANPDSSGAFVLGLLSHDGGWPIAFFDTLSRVSDKQQQHLTQPERLKHLYEAYRLPSNSRVNAAHGVYGKTPDLLVLFTRVQWDANGAPLIPGGIQAWKDVLDQKSGDPVMRDQLSHSRSWSTPEDVLASMTALTHVSFTPASSPLQVFLTALEIDRNRQPENRLKPATIKALASRYAEFNLWYQIFAEFPDLDDAAITRFIAAADAVDNISNQVLRANAEGSFQASVGLWQILARQGQIPPQDMSASWLRVTEPFLAITSSTQLFDATRTSLSAVITATGRKPDSSEDQIVELLAGPQQASSDGQRIHKQLAGRISTVIEDQRLASLDTLFALSDGLKRMAQSGGKGDDLIPLAEELREFDLPRPIFTRGEKRSWAPAIYTSHHSELQIRTDITRILKQPASPTELENARGLLTPFLRDTIVGLNYAYYEPPGAQILHHNPLFVRSHDFLGISLTGANQIWRAPQLLGAGVSAGGGAYLMGSLADLSYALATTEQDFIAPKNVQALIWDELVPVLMVSATIPRWWSVTPSELHAVTLYQRSGEELLTAASTNPALREKVSAVLADRVAPQRMEEIAAALPNQKRVAALIPRLMPAEVSFLATEFRLRYPDEPPTWGPSAKQLDELQKSHPADVSWDRISRDFGVPHPTIAQTNGTQLLNIKPLPKFGGYSSRLFGESWESSNLYWARLADEMGYSPAALNILVPELTRATVANIFASDIEDWQAILRAMQLTGDEFRQGKIASLAKPATTSLLSTPLPNLTPASAQ